MKDWIVIDNIIAIAALVTAITIVVIFASRILKFFKKAVHFFDDFLGEEGRPGVPPRPGFSERMTKMEDCVNKVNDRLDNIEEKIQSIDVELQPNSGSSMRDAINRIEKRIEELESRRRADRIVDGLEND